MENVITVKCNNCGYSHDTDIGQAFKVCIECKEGYDMPEGVECENLDCVDASELEELIKKNIGTQNEFVALQSDYAYARLWAMKCRLSGQMSRASHYEQACEQIYKRLPEALKW